MVAHLASPTHRQLAAAAAPYWTTPGHHRIQLRGVIQLQLLLQLLFNIFWIYLAIFYDFLLILKFFVVLEIIETCLHGVCIYM